jgi:hypothetical protein
MQGAWQGIQKCGKGLRYLISASSVGNKTISEALELEVEKLAVGSSVMLQ